MLSSVAVPVISKRYILQNQLGSGGMGSVYRALDRLTGQAVALKRVLSPKDVVVMHADDSTDARLALAQEFKILASLRHPNIISVIDYGFDEQHQPFYTMELLENARTILQAASDLSLAGKIDLLIQMLWALAYLHRRGVLHRDLKPANILVVDNQLKVLDFGLSSGRNDQNTSTSGTLAYIAPEVLRGESITEATDFYAVGVIAYELFAGQHPFDTATITGLIQQVLYAPLDMEPLRSALTENARLAVVIERLLSKYPENRFGSADAIITALGKATDQQFPNETAATRESFLQAAQFVGREAELEALSSALGQTLDRKGGAWLVSGESGVGKTRLLDELRTLALVRGAVVLRGQALSEGGRTYQVWRDVLRLLCLLTDLSPLEAGVLKPLVPDIAALSEAPIQDSTELEPDAAQERLFSVIEDLFKRPQQPALVILEDLQWSRGESIDLFIRLTSLIKDLPVLIVGSYRSDETPPLPARIPGAQHLKLNRLTEESIATLSESILGEGGRQPEVVNWLRRETEGNVFFLVEVVRAVAEEVGQLDRIGGITLPTHIFAGGIARIVARRLRQVPVEAYPLLQIAAVLGRELDSNVLHCADQSTSIAQWLAMCAEATVIEIQNERWAFAHDKLREALINDLSPEQRQALHRTSAMAIERAYPDSLEQAERLVYYWSIAGDSAKESYYAGVAALAAMQVGAYRHAQTLLERALALSPAPQDEQQRLQQGRWEIQLADVYIAIGNLPECMRHNNRALSLLDRPLPGSNLALASRIPLQAVKLLTARFRPIPAARREMAVEGVEALKRAIKVAIASTRLLIGLYTVLRLIGLAERAEATAERAMGYAFLATVAGYGHLTPLANYSLAQVNQALAALPEKSPAKGPILILLGLYYFVHMQWAEMRQTLDEGIRLHDQIGDRANGSIARIFLSAGLYHQSRFDEAAAHCKAVIDSKLGSAMVDTGAYSGLALQSMLADEPLETGESVWPSPIDSMPAMNRVSLTSNWDSI